MIAARMTSRAIFLCWATAGFVTGFSAITQAHPGLHHDWQQASQAMDAQPWAAEPRLQRSQIARLQGHLLISYYEARWARALAPQDPAGWRAQGLAAQGLGLSAEAESYLDAYFQEGGQAVDARVARAELRWLRGSTAEALQDLDEAIHRKPDVESALLRARWLRSIGAGVRAAEGLQDLLPKLGGALLLRRELVSVRLELGQGKAALALVDQALKFAPQDVDWLLQRSRVLKALSRGLEAHTTLQQALHTVDNAMLRRPTALRLAQRAEVRLELGDRAGASKDLTEALHKSPTFPKARALAAKLDVSVPPEETLR